jgi:hypothetical protein
LGKGSRASLGKGSPACRAVGRIAPGGRRTGLGRSAPPLATGSGAWQFLGGLTAAGAQPEVVLSIDRPVHTSPAPLEDVGLPVHTADHPERALGGAGGVEQLSPAGSAQNTAVVAREDILGPAAPAIGVQPVRSRSVSLPGHRSPQRTRPISSTIGRSPVGAEVCGGREWSRRGSGVRTPDSPAAQPSVESHRCDCGPGTGRFKDPRLPDSDQVL